MARWAAEVVVDETLARSLIHEQFPELAAREVRLLSEGWDSTVFVVDEEWVFRFPRRAIVLPGLETELALLPRLAPLLPVAVPVAELVGRPTDGFRWPFAGARLIPGREASGPEHRSDLAVPLARALGALHASETLAAVGELRTDGNRRADMELRVPFTRERLAEIAELWAAPVDGILAVAEALPPSTPAAVCHGDLHFRHLIVDGGELRGLIDWIDVCHADPAIDLQLYWSFFDPPARAAFLAEYGPVSDAALLRARVIALFLNAMLLQYGTAERNDGVTREALGGLRRTVVG